MILEITINSSGINSSNIFYTHASFNHPFVCYYYVHTTIFVIILLHTQSVSQLLNDLTIPAHFFFLFLYIYFIFFIIHFILLDLMMITIDIIVFCIVCRKISFTLMFISIFVFFLLSCIFFFFLLLFS